MILWDFRHLIDDAGKRFAVFRIKGAAQHLDFLDGIHLGLHRGLAGKGIHHGDTIDHVLDFVGPTAPKMTIDDAGLQIDHGCDVLDGQHCDFIPAHSGCCRGQVSLDERAFSAYDDFVHRNGLALKLKSDPRRQVD